jgi:tartrate dehydratase alpha subunit/fumarate hydratase class I-like protein
MKEINVRRIEDAVASMCADIAVNCGSDIAQALEAAKEKEEGEMASAAMAILQLLRLLALANRRRD